MRACLCVCARDGWANDVTHFFWWFAAFGTFSPFSPGCWSPFKMTWAPLTSALMRLMGDSRVCVPHPLLALCLYRCARSYFDCLLFYCTFSLLSSSCPWASAHPPASQPPVPAPPPPLNGSNLCLNACAPLRFLGRISECA